MNTGEHHRPAGVRALSTSVILAVLCTATILVPAAIAEAAPKPAPAARSNLTVDEAVKRAHRTGKPVEATASASETTTVTANPNGTITYTQSATPTRGRVGGQWRNLDATLVRNADGTWSPKLAQAPLTLSGGGTGPMVVVGGASLNAAIGAPVKLPSPTVSGPTATYTGVLPGVDLRVTARISGGFSDVFVIRDAAAATNPALAELDLPLTTTGLTVTADSAGNITGRGRTGQAVLTAPAPTMWDSTASAKASRVDPAGITRETTTGQPAKSTPRGPGAAAHIGRLSATIRSGHLKLTPDKAVLKGARIKYPVYIDPTFTWNSQKGTFSGWATISQDYPSTNYWKSTPDPNGRMQVGYSGSIRSRTLLNFSVPTSVLSGATINTAQLRITETWSYSCSARQVDLYAPDATLGPSNATWNAWAGQDLGSVIDSQNVSYGYSSSCPSNGVLFDVKSAIVADLSPPKKLQTFVLKAASESDTSAWKEFLETSPTLAITYNHTPNQPSALHTSPATSCSAGDSVGEGSVFLYATVSDPDSGALGVTFKLWPAGSSTPLVTTNPQTFYYSSGSTAVLKVPAATLDNVTPAGGTATFDWQVQATDYGASSSWSKTCSFVFDRTRPGAPDLVPPADGSTTVGQPVTIAVTSNAPVQPTKYLYQLNGGPYDTKTASSGAAQITVIPTRFTNTLTVTSQSDSGNIGDTASVTFNSTPVDTAVDADLDGDDLTDLVTVGGSHGIAPGLWVASGKGNGTTDPTAVDIGSHGNGIATPDVPGNPAQFTGAQIITGHFGGLGPQDVLAYYPANGAGVIMRGNGDGSTIQAQLSGTYIGIDPGSLSGLDINDFQPISDPRQLANAGEHDDRTIPDLLGIANKPNGSSLLTYYTSGGTAGVYTEIAPLTNPTPTGGSDWTTWSITAAQTKTGTALFLWQSSTGKLYLWNNALYDASTGSLTYTPYLLSTSFNTGGTVTLQAADINGDDTADLWAVGDGAVATAWLVSGLDTTAATGTLTAQTSQKVLTGTHAWLLDDYTDADLNGAVLNADATHPAADSIGTLTATASTASATATWHAGDLFDPDVNLKSGALATTAQAVNSSKDFTVDVWAKPTALDGTVLSQDGSNNASFRLWIDAATASWRFAISSADAANPTWTVANTLGGAVKLGAWTHLTASYQSSTSSIMLYINDQLADLTTVSSAPWTGAKTNAFRIGAVRTSSTAVGSYFQGQVAEAQTFDQAIDPQPMPHNGVWDHTRKASGVWATKSVLVENNSTITQTTAATTTPDGSAIIFSLVPGNGVWFRVRNPAGEWQVNATRLDTNGTISEVAAATTPDGKVHLLTLVPGSGVWYRSRSAAGVWDSSATHIDTNTATTAIALAALPDGTLWNQLLIPGSGIWARTRSATGTWASSAVHTDTNGTITDVAVAALPDGTVHSLVLVPNNGVYERIRTAAGTWGTSTTNFFANTAITGISVGGAPNGTLTWTSYIPNSGLWVKTTDTSGAWQNAVQIDWSSDILDTYTIITSTGETHIGSITRL